MGFIERLFERLGLVADTDEQGNSDEYLPISDPLATPSVGPVGWVSNVRAERIRSGVEPCPHLRETELLPTDTTPDKLYRCDECGLTYRHIVDEVKPWLIRGYQPVGVKS